MYVNDRKRASYGFWKQGKSYKEITELLPINPKSGQPYSEKTIENWVAGIKRKMKVYEKYKAKVAAAEAQRVKNKQGIGNGSK